jgi:hypothetical protein
VCAPACAEGLCVLCSGGVVCWKEGRALGEGLKDSLECAVSVGGSWEQLNPGCWLGIPRSSPLFRVRVLCQDQQKASPASIPDLSFVEAEDQQQTHETAALRDSGHSPIDSGTVIVLDLDTGQLPASPPVHSSPQQCPNQINHLSRASALLPWQYSSSCQQWASAAAVA